jgi:ankyrin repeat protein
MFTLQVSPFAFSNGCTPLMKALVEKDETTMLTILETDPSTINVQCDQGLSALHIACYSSELSCFSKILLEHGSDPNQMGRYNQTPIYILLACGKVTLELLQLFVEYGVNSSCFNNSLPLLLNNSNTQVDESIIEFLLSHGENINSKSGGATALSYALSNYDPKIIKYLLIHGADPTLANPSVGRPVVKYINMIIEFIRLEEENKRLEDENALLRLHPLPGSDFIQLYKDEFPNTNPETFMEAYIPILRNNLADIFPS